MWEDGGSLYHWDFPSSDRLVRGTQNRESPRVPHVILEIATQPQDPESFPINIRGSIYLSTRWHEPTARIRIDLEGLAGLQASHKSLLCHTSWASGYLIWWNVLNSTYHGRVVFSYPCHECFSPQIPAWCTQLSVRPSLAMQCKITPTLPHPHIPYSCLVFLQSIFYHLTYICLLSFLPC